MIQSHEIRYHRDGSIDFNFYRTRATALRLQALHDAFKLKAAFKFTLIALTTIIGATFATSAPAHLV